LCDVTSAADALDIAHKREELADAGKAVTAEAVNSSPCPRLVKLDAETRIRGGQLGIAEGAVRIAALETLDAEIKQRRVAAVQHVQQVP